MQTKVKKEKKCVYTCSSPPVSFYYTRFGIILGLHKDGLSGGRESHAGAGRDDRVGRGIVVIRLLVLARSALASVEHRALHEIALGVGVIHIARGQLGEAVLHARHAHVHAGTLGDGAGLGRSETERSRQHLTHREVSDRSHSAFVVSHGRKDGGSAGIRSGRAYGQCSPAVQFIHIGTSIVQQNIGRSGDNLHRIGDLRLNHGHSTVVGEIAVQN
mmetsp:Transcript_33611/g.57659  ORF Transcript_33611/g.57659 Transcript_33611/m.57659 type:complete len:216 (+) Transcript_33611:121-768(+)